MRVAEVTETWVWAVTAPEVAVRVAVPAATAVASPELFTETTAGVALDQVTVAVRSLVVPSE